MSAQNSIGASCEYLEWCRGKLVANWLEMESQTTNFFNKLKQRRSRALQTLAKKVMNFSKENPNMQYYTDNEG